MTKAILPPLVSLVICNYNTEDFLLNCLDSIRKLKVSFPIETIVVDNNSQDKSVERVQREFPEVVLVANSENRWMTGGFNDGLKVSEGRYICFLNADVLLDPDCIQKLTEFLMKRPEFGAASCKTFMPDGAMVRSSSKDYPLSLAFLNYTFLGKLFPKLKWKMFEDFRYSDWDRNTEREVEVSYAHCLMMSKEALNACGAFDERFRLFYSENDLARRMRSKGWKTGYTPEASLIHFEHKSLERADLNDIAFVYEHDIYRYYRKYYGTFPILALFLLVSLTNVLVSLKFFQFKRMLSLFIVPARKDRKVQN